MKNVLTMSKECLRFKDVCNDDVSILIISLYLICVSVYLSKFVLCWKPQAFGELGAIVSGNSFGRVLH